MQVIQPVVEEPTASRQNRIFEAVYAAIQSRFVRRAAGLIGIGLLNAIIVIALGVALILLSPIQTPGNPWRRYWEFVRFDFTQTVTSALLLSPMFLLACILVLARQRLIYRVSGGLVTILFLAILLAFPGPGYAVGLEHFIVFWLCLVTLIPVRILFSLSIHWSDEPPRQTRTGQFTIGDILSWTAAIAMALACFPMSRMFIGSSTWTLGAIGASSVVAVPCICLAFSRANRVRGSFWITLWVLGASLFWLFSLLCWYYNFQQAPGYPWYQVMLFGARVAVYLLALQISLLGNIFALEWLGVQWTRAPFRLTPSP